MEWREWRRREKAAWRWIVWVKEEGVRAPKDEMRNGWQYCSRRAAFHRLFESGRYIRRCFLPYSVLTNVLYLSYIYFALILSHDFSPTYLLSWFVADGIWRCKSACVMPDGLSTAHEFSVYLSTHLYIYTYILYLKNNLLMNIIVMSSWIAIHF